MADYVFTQNGDNNVQIGTDRLTGDFKGASMFATVEQARQYNRLRQYEDTGLTPGEIAALRAELDALKADIEAGRLVRILCRCERCEYWDKEYIAPNPDFHFCKYDQTFTPSWHYCGHAYNRAALEGGQHGADQT
jgi:hypothetical protein